MEKMTEKILHKLHKKIKFSIMNFFSKCDQIRRKLQIRSNLLKKLLMENLTFCAAIFVRSVANSVGFLNMLFPYILSLGTLQDPTTRPTIYKEA